MNHWNNQLGPSFLNQLSQPKVKRIFLTGCGGGFDFVHGMLLYPVLRSMGKEVTIGSYSFGDPTKIGDADTVFHEGQALAKRVTAASTPSAHYGPEVHICAFLDQKYPEDAPHSMYAYYARAFSVPVLTRLYSKIVAENEVDAVVLVDGGSDSLMRGDEEGLGDPVEDCVSVTAVADLKGLHSKILISVGLGCDRFNQVSDAASLRAIAELTQAGGFLGAIALEPETPASLFYRQCLEHIYANQSFRSILAGAIAAAIEGEHGAGCTTQWLAGRVSPGQLFLWPLMAMLWAFDVNKVAERSLMSSWIRELPSHLLCQATIEEKRGKLKEGIRPVEELPRHIEFRNSRL